MTTVRVAPARPMAEPEQLCRRLLLSAAGVRHLLALAAGHQIALVVPDPFLTGPDEPAETVRAALCEVGALAEDEPHPAVLAGLALVADPGVPRLVVRAATAFRRRLTVLALGGGLGASLARDVADDGPGPVEQSVFSPALLREEILRCLPPLPGPAPQGKRGGLTGADPAALLAALSADLPAAAQRMLCDDPEATPVLHALSGRFQASLEVTVSAQGAGETVVDRLLWVAADGGWWSLRPGGNASGPLLDVLPVSAGDLPAEVAPLLAGAVAATLAPYAGQPSR